MHFGDIHKTLTCTIWVSKEFFIAFTTLLTIKPSLARTFAGIFVTDLIIWSFNLALAFWKRIFDFWGHKAKVCQQNPVLKHVRHSCNVLLYNLMHPKQNISEFFWHTFAYSNWESTKDRKYLCSIWSYALNTYLYNLGIQRIFYRIHHTFDH